MTNSYISKKCYLSIYNEINVIDNSLYDENIMNLKNYILTNGSDKYQKILILSYCSYVIKIDLAIPTDKYDLILDGNMGYNGENLFIKDIINECSDKSCLFLIDNNNGFQVNKKIRNFIKENYIKIDDLVGEDLNYSVYSNVGE